MRIRGGCLWILLISVFSLPALAGAPPSLVHGMWVWKSPSVLATPGGAEELVKYCQAEGINEVYVSVSEQSEAAEENQLTHLIKLLHRSNVRAEALISSTDADEPGRHRDNLLRHVQEIVQFNHRHPENRFDGIHLDVEPQQRRENKGAGNLRFLPGLVDAFRAARAMAEPAGMTVNADIQMKLLKGSSGDRRILLSAVPRVTLMMYELSSLGDGESFEQKAEKVEKNSQRYLDLAFDGLNDRNLARMAIALRTPDYADLLPQMLQKLDDANRANPHYLGWARHSYNDQLKAGSDAR